MTASANWLRYLVDTTTFLLERLFNGMFVVLPEVPNRSVLLVKKTSCEDSMKIDFTSF